MFLSITLDRIDATCRDPDGVIQWLTTLATRDLGLFRLKVKVTEWSNNFSGYFLRRN